MRNYRMRTNRQRRGTESRHTRGTEAGFAKGGRSVLEANGLYRGAVAIGGDGGAERHVVATQCRIGRARQRYLCWVDRGDEVMCDIAGAIHSHKESAAIRNRSCFSRYR